jgi:hypothetical protein
MAGGMYVHDIDALLSERQLSGFADSARAVSSSGTLSASAD